MEKHRGDLDKAQEEYGVDKTIITAIILVETRLGSYVGNRPILNTLSTMAAIADKTERGNAVERHFRLKTPDKGQI